jgi:hypothetical protein
MASEDPTQAYDEKHGKPGAQPDKPQISHDDEWGESQNPVRESGEPFKDLQKPGS